MDGKMDSNTIMLGMSTLPVIITASVLAVVSFTQKDDSDEV
jgi:hypothetical protein